MKHKDATVIKACGYALASHIRACRVEGSALLLDLRFDRFIGIDSRSACSLACHITGWPSDHEDAAMGCDAPRSDISAMLQAMQHRGILMEAPLNSQPVEQRAAAPPYAALMEHYGDNPVAFGGKNLLRLCTACLTVAVTLRHRGLRGVLSRLSSHWRRTGHTRDAIQEREVLALATAYFRFRSLLFTARGACLFDSLVLHEFMRRCGADVTLVIGVRTRPFGSHAWVQHGGIVLNDSLGRVLKYTPIVVA